MKIRANLKFFLSKKGGSLERFCERNNVKTRKALLELLDDVSVAHPDPKELAALFPDRVESSKKEVKRVTKKPSAPATQKVAPEESSSSKSKSSRSSRRRTRKTRSASASEE